MTRFGESFLFAEKHNLASKIGFKFYGFPFIASWLRSIYFQRALKQISFSKALDVGCGAGEYSFFLAKKYPNLTISSCDLFEKGIEKNKETQKKMNVDNINFFKSNLFNLKGKQVYDFVFCIGVLQTVKNKRKAFTVFNRLLKENGFLFFDVGIGEGISERPLVHWMGDAGFDFVDVRTSFGFFGSLAESLDVFLMKLGFVRVFTLPFLKFFALLDVFVINRTGRSLVVLAKKKQNLSRGIQND